MYYIGYHGSQQLQGHPNNQIGFTLGRSKANRWPRVHNSIGSEDSNNLHEEDNSIHFLNYFFYLIYNDKRIGDRDSFIGRANCPKLKWNVHPMKARCLFQGCKTCNCHWKLDVCQPLAPATGGRLHLLSVVRVVCAGRYFLINNATLHGANLLRIWLFM